MLSGTFWLASLVRFGTDRYLGRRRKISFTRYDHHSMVFEVTSHYTTARVAGSGEAGNPAVAQSHVEHLGVALAQFELAARQIGYRDRPKQIGQAIAGAIDQLSYRGRRGAPAATVRIVRQRFEQASFQRLHRIEHRDLIRPAGQRTPAGRAALAIEEAGVAQGRHLLLQKTFGDLLAQGNIVRRQPARAIALLLNRHIDKGHQAVDGFPGKLHLRAQSVRPGATGAAQAPPPDAAGSTTLKSYRHTRYNEAGSCSSLRHPV